MKYTVILFSVCVLCLFSCVKNKIGDGFNVICVCVQDSVSTTYPLGNKYQPYIDTNKLNPAYTDSCNALEKLHGFDSGKVYILAH